MVKMMQRLGLPNTGGGGGANTNDMNGKAGGSGVNYN